MTIKQAVEIIRQQFPEYGDTQIIKDLDLSQKLFADETRLLKKSATITSFTPVTATPKGLQLSLPVNTAQVLNITFYEGTNSLIHNTFGWSYDELNYYYTNLSSLLTTVPTNLKQIVIEYIAYPTTLVLPEDAIYNNASPPAITTPAVVGTTEFEIDSAFHYAVLADVLQRYWAVKGILQSAAYWKGEYVRYRQQAKKRAILSYGSNMVSKGLL